MTARKAALAIVLMAVSMLVLVAAPSGARADGLMAAPDIIITSPAANHINVNGTVFFDILASDTDGDFDRHHWSVHRDGVLVGEGDSADLRLVFSLDLDDGNYTVTDQAFDLAGGSQTTSTPFQVDTAAPMVNILHPYGYINTTTVTASWEGFDVTSGLDRFEVRLDDGAWEPMGLDTSGTYHDLSVGSHTLGLQAFDRAGSSVFTQVTFTIDITPPVLLIDQPVDGGWSSMTSETVHWSVTDDLSPVYTIFAREVRGGLLGGWFSIPYTSSSFVMENLADGVNGIDLMVRNAAGLEAEASVRWTTDTQAPELTILFPQEGMVNTTAEVSMNWTVSDGGSGVALRQWWLYRDDALMGHSEDYIFDRVTYLDLPEGNYTLRVRVEDGAGNEAVREVHYKVDTQAPWLHLFGPMDGSLIGGAADLGWEGGDAVTTVHYTLSVDGGMPVAVTSPLSLSLDEGSHNLVLTAWDDAGHSVSVTRQYLVDLSSPWLSIGAPADGSLRNTSEVRVQWSAGDAISDSFEVEYRLNGGGWTTLTEGDLVLNLGDGTYLLEMRAIDQAGNEATAQLAFTVDDTDPAVLSDEPSGHEVHPNATLSVEFSEPMRWAKIRVDGVMGQPGWSGSTCWFDPDGPLEAGKTYLAVVTGEDIAGNPVQHAYTFTVTTTGIIEGVVVDVEGNPVENATVILDDGAANTTTDSEGRFRFEVEAGNHTVTVIMPGYDAVTSKVEVTPGDTAPASGSSTSMVLRRSTPPDLSTVIAIVAVAMLMAIGILYLLVTKRKKLEEEQEKTKTQRRR